MDVGPTDGKERRGSKRSSRQNVRGSGQMRNNRGKRGGRGGAGQMRLRQPQIPRYEMPEMGPDGVSVLSWRNMNMDKTTVVEALATADGPPDAFTLFCAYHLGITAQDSYQKPQIEEIARRFALESKQLRELLLEYQLDEESLRKLDFDLEGAKMDVRVAPPGISRKAIARDFFEELLAARAETGN